MFGRSAICKQWSAKELLEAGVTVRLVVLLFEGALVELPQAEGADKMFRVVLAEHSGDAATRDRLVTARTQRAPLCMVVSLAVRLTLVIVEAASVERLAAIAADEALGVPLAIEGRDVVLGDGTVAASALGGKQLEVIFLTEGLPILVMKAPFPKLLATLGAEEVLRVPCLVQGSYAFIQNGAIAVCTPRGEDVVVVCLTVGLVVTLKEVLGAQLLVAVGTREVPRMPGAP